MRKVTLFTGQWADLPIEQLAARTGAWGYDGLELACWGDHFDVAQALADPAYVRGRRELLERHGLGCWAISAHLVGQAICDPIDARHQAVLPPCGLGRRRARRGAPAGRAVARGHGAGRRRVRGDPGQRLHRLERVASALLVPPQRLRGHRGRLPRLRRAPEPGDRRLRRRGRPLRPRGPPHRDRLRLRDHAQGPRGDRTAPRLRDQLRPEPLRAPVPQPGRLRGGVRGSHLPRPCQGLAQAPRRPPFDPRPPTSTSARPSAAGTSSPPATATSTSRRSSARSTASATRARSRSNGRTRAWTANGAPGTR